MPNPIPPEAIIGNRYGLLVAIALHGEGRTSWLCACDCGNIVIVKMKELRSGNTTSCGCRRTKKLLERNTKHGCATRTRRTPEFQIWEGIKARCYNPGHEHYAEYGGRGIKVLWTSFEEFHAAMGDKPSPLHTVDRKDSDGHYCTENCRWATRKEQSRNKRNTRWVEWQGRRQCLADWAEELGLSYAALALRLYKSKWTVEQAFTTPMKDGVGEGNIRSKLNCEDVRLIRENLGAGIPKAQIARQFGVSAAAIRESREGGDGRIRSKRKPGAGVRVVPADRWRPLEAAR